MTCNPPDADRERYTLTCEFCDDDLHRIADRTAEAEAMGWREGTAR